MGSFKFLATTAVCFCLATPLVAMDSAEMKEAYNMAETLRKAAKSDEDLAKALIIQQDLYEQGNFDDRHQQEGQKQIHFELSFTVWWTVDLPPPVPYIVIQGYAYKA